MYLLSRTSGLQAKLLVLLPLAFPAAAAHSENWKRKDQGAPFHVLFSANFSAKGLFLSHPARYKQNAPEDPVEGPWDPGLGAHCKGTVEQNLSKIISVPARTEPPVRD